MRVRNSGGRGTGVRMGLLGTVFAAAIALTLPAQAARPIVHHPAPAHHPVPAHHAPIRHIVAHAKPAHGRSITVASTHAGKAHVAARPVKRHVIPTAKAQLRRAPHAAAVRHVVHSKTGKARIGASLVSYRGGISCVPFARAASGIELKGNATNWWEAASGIYARGARPEAGSVLNFRSTGKMRLGHVAVVARVINAREVEIDHANWAGPGARKGGVSRGIPVIDVSPRNDWTAVRVGLGRSGEFGSVYPTYGFIYDRPDRGVMVANTLAPAHGGLVPVRGGPMSVEVAEAPLHGRGSMNVVDAPNRAIR